MSGAQPELLQGMEIRPEFVILDLEADNDKDAIEKLANRLLQEGMVKPGYVPAILKREEDYSTGLKFEDMGIAIPHTDVEHVIKPCLAIGVLRRPVVFASMGMPEIPCEVEMVIPLGVVDPETQLDFLKTLMQIFQAKGKLKALQACKTPEETVELFKSYFV